MLTQTLITIFVGSVVCLNRADYPAPSQVPSINAEWTSIVQSQVGTVRPEISKCSQPNQWAFTYDDGPSPSTAVVLDALVSCALGYKLGTILTKWNQAARGQKATFFVIGSNVLQNKDMLKRIVREGHEIGSHTWSHTALPSLSFGQIVSGNLEYRLHAVNF